MAKVKYLFKNKGERCKKENYRPISMLKSFSKVLESVVDSQIRDFVGSADVQRKQNTQKEFHQTKNQKNT